MTLKVIKDSLDGLGEWLKEMARRKFYSLDHLKGIVDGAYRVLLDLLSQAEYPKIIKVKESDEDALTGYVTVFDHSYPIYLDDYGQSFYTKVDNQDYCFGTYNTDIVPELISLILAKLTKDMLKEVEDIYNGKS